MIDDLILDLRGGARMLARRPGFTFAAVLVLALGIGGNTAIISFFDAALLRPPEVADPGRLVWVHAVSRLGRASGQVSFLDYADLRDGAEVFSELAAYAGGTMALTTEAGPEQVNGQLVSGSYFRLLGLRPFAGRAFLPEEDVSPGARPVAVLSHALWKRRFGSDPAVVGASITLNGRSFAVVGIAPEGFSGLEIGEAADLWVPLMMHAWGLPSEPGLLISRNARRLTLVGRLAPQVDRRQAAAAMTALAARQERDHPESHEGFTLAVSPIRGAVSPEGRGEVVAVGALLLAVTGAVLLIACANVAGLLLGRAAERAREIGVRMALGASRGRLIRQLLTESVLLALVSGGAGLVLAVWGLEAALSIEGAPSGLAALAAPGARVFVYAAGISALAGLAFGLAPAWTATRREAAAAIKQEARLFGRAVGRSRLQGALVVGQIALSSALLIASGLLLRSLGMALAESPGFDPRGVVSVSFDPGLLGYGRDASADLGRRLLSRVAGLPGVSAATLASVTPLSGTMAGTAAWPEVAGDDGAAMVHFSDVWPGFFETLRIPLAQGRGFTFQDGQGAPEVAVVNETLARTFWPGKDPVGRTLRVGDAASAPLTVIGVASDGKYDDFTDRPRPFVYLPWLQRPAFRSELTLLARAEGSEAAALALLREEVRAIDAHLPPARLGTMEQTLWQRADKRRGISSLLASFGGLALALACVGLYGVVACSVTRRARETGVRLALGARPAEIVRLFVGEGARLTAGGLVLGAALSLILARMMSALMYGVGPADALTFAAVSALLGLSAVVACWLPARRASRMDPVAALRSE
ncbi:MAG TPA: ABC transporter permease [Candidatus Polarisedimenticolia bacterium]|nr:ABC transporter permease [Candidatus Polarisedimenticolia bacterium]